MNFYLLEGAKREGDQITYLIKPKKGQEMFVNSTEARKFAASVIDFLEGKLDWMEGDDEEAANAHSSGVLVKPTSVPSKVICMYIVHYVMNMQRFN